MKDGFATVRYRSLLFLSWHRNTVHLDSRPLMGYAKFPHWEDVLQSCRGGC